MVYDTAYNIFSAFEREKFKGKNELTVHYFDCDLLIVDDLGTELVTPFTVSALYNLINTRLLEGRRMVINTNYEMSELENYYSERVTVRLLREFSILKFANRVF
ncbi:hypothetical protein SDC9_106422 [bioreactor metagenome]|uniref:IstB-like ATP-binding protein domain-containing protein n=1 Tax=bioreactor metagenome TaxID=1076179 RepID=A0A645B3D7_9ZZZZ